MESIKEQIRDILSKQDLGVLATYNPEQQQPYATIVAFHNSADLTEVFFATPVATRKYENLQQCPKVSLLIDSRKNDGTDIGTSAAVTVIGIADEIPVEESKHAQSFIEKHQQLANFIASPSTAFFSIKVSKYVLVNRFQDVQELSFET